MSAQLQPANGLLPAGVTLQHNPEYMHLRFSEERQVVSSAVLNGGVCSASGLVNLRVEGESQGEHEDPAATLQSFAFSVEQAGITVGMMTAASMDSLRIESEVLEQHTLAVLVTTGLRNARRAGDPAELRSLALQPTTAGTINTVVLCSAGLAEEAMVEMIMIVTEAKAAVLQDLKVVSPVTGAIATGTGTDAVAIVSGCGSQLVRYAGKHTLMGERLAVLTMNAIRSSLDYKTQGRT